GADAVRAVDRAEPWCELGEGHAAHRAGVPLAEQLRHGGRGSGRRDLDECDAVAVPEGDLDRVGEPPLDSRSEHDAVDQHLDRVGLRLRERDVVAEVHEHTIDACADEPATPELVELTAVLALAATHDRRVDPETASIGVPAEPI